MQLNIKNSKTYELATNLSQLTEENLTQAVTKAIDERLERVKSRFKVNLKGYLKSYWSMPGVCETSIP